jgi:energy-coupling factor transport system permease protein
LLPEIRIVLYIIFVVSLFLFVDLTAYLILLGVVVALLLTLPFKRLRSGIIPISLFLVFTFLSNVINQPGKIMFSTGPIILTEEGFHIALLRTMRLFFMIAGVKILMGYTETDQIINALGRLMSPLERLGIPVKDFFHTMGLTMKCFPVLKDTAAATYREKMKTDEIRGFWNRARMVSLFLLPMFVKSIQSPESFFEKGNINEEES